MCCIYLSCVYLWWLIISANRQTAEISRSQMSSPFHQLSRWSRAVSGPSRAVTTLTLTRFCTCPTKNNNYTLMSTLQRPKANLANAKSLSLESISVSHSISSRPTIPLTPASSTLPIHVFLVRETCAQKAQYHSELPSTPILLLICSSTSSSSSITLPPAMA